MTEYVIRFLAGGLVVSAFAMLGEQASAMAMREDIFMKRLAIGVLHI